MRRVGRTAVFVGGLAITLYAIAANSGSGWLYVVSAGMAAVVLVSALAPLRSVRGIEVVRRSPPVGCSGEPLECEIEVINKGRLPRYLLEMTDGFVGGEGQAVLARVSGGGKEKLRYTIESPHRGIYSGGEVVVESGAPFGLFRGRGRLWVSSRAVIHPRTFEVASLPRPASREASGAERDESDALHRGLEGEFWGVREYRPGDPTRLIAWRQSARSLATGRLSVLELAQETDPPLSVALNLDPRAPRGAREMAVSAAASLLVRALREGRGVHADAGPQREPFPEQPDEEAILTWCAGLAASHPPATADADVEILPSLKDARPSGKSSAVVLVSCREFAGRGPWMTAREERGFAEAAEYAGRRVAVLGPDVHEPWRLA